LSFMNGNEFLNALALHKNAIGHECVDTVAGINLNVLVSNRQCNFAFDLNTSRTQFMRQALLISGFERWICRKQSTSDVATLSTSVPFVISFVLFASSR
jgi:hypothetical protein